MTNSKLIYRVRLLSRTKQLTSPALWKLDLCWCSAFPTLFHLSLMWQNNDVTKHNLMWQNICLTSSWCEICWLWPKEGCVLAFSFFSQSSYQLLSPVLPMEVSNQIKLERNSWKYFLKTWQCPNQNQEPLNADDYRHAGLHRGGGKGWANSISLASSGALYIVMHHYSSTTTKPTRLIFSHSNSVFNSNSKLLQHHQCNSNKQTNKQIRQKKFQWNVDSNGLWNTQRH